MMSSNGGAGADGGADVDLRNFEKKTVDELDDILNAALDELEHEEDFASLGQRGRATATTGFSGSSNGAGTGTGQMPMTVPGTDGKTLTELEEAAADDVAESMEKLLRDFNDPEVMASLESAFNDIGKTKDGAAEIASMAAQADAVEALKAKKEHFPHLSEQSDVDKSVAKTLEAISKSAAEFEGQDMGDMEGAGEDIMKEMIAEFEKLGEKEDYNEVMDNLMQQLLSRELMYDPIKSICDKYPEWLANNKDALSEQDYQRLGSQYQYLQRILAVYETEPDNFTRLMELMQDLQEYGQIPAEIVKELAPGLEFNGEGLPVMPNMGEGMMPNDIAGMMGMKGVDPANCCIM